MEDSEVFGAIAGGIGGGLFGFKLSLGLGMAALAIPVIGPVITGVLLTGSMATGAYLGAQNGQKSPASGTLNLVANLAGLPLPPIGGGENNPGA